MRVLALLPMLGLIGAAPANRLDVVLLDLRSDKGDVRLCLTRDPDHFPDCKDDPHASRLSAPANAVAGLGFSSLPSGTYAVSVVHDENGNGRLDTFAGIPREGFGFSRNPALRFGPPSFVDARFTLTTGETGQTIRMKYML